MVAAPDFARHLKNTYASETPVTDGERVYAYFGNVGVFAFTLDGEPVWERRFEAVSDALRLGHGSVADRPRRAALHRERQTRTSPT